jgi:hypothetical protein
VSPPDSTSGAKAPLLKRIDVYTVMLATALMALLLGCILMAMELARYNWDMKASSVPRAAALSTGALNLVFDRPAMELTAQAS